jgi:cytochrome P450
VNYNPFLPEVKADPYPYYRWLREEHPVYRVEPMGFYAVSRYEDVHFVLRSHALFSSEIVGSAGLGRDSNTKTNISCDPPDHTRLRTIVNRGFTPRVIADWEPRIRQILDGLMRDLPQDREFDLIRDLAMPLPVQVIAEMLGVEPERQADFKHWSDLIVDTYGVGDAMTPAELEAAEAELARFQEYFRSIMAKRRDEPSDDLISVLVQAEAESDRLSESEVLAFTALLLVAGNETTTNLIGNAVLALLANPDEMQKAIDDPSLIPNVVEEALRYDPPVQLLFRQALEDVEIAGVTIPKGAPVLPLFASANRDERKYPDPDRFDVSRDTQGHFAFGQGIHFCLGAPLARLEARLTFERLLPLLPSMSLASEEIERVPAFMLRGPRRLALVREPGREGDLVPA